MSKISKTSAFSMKAVKETASSAIGNEKVKLLFSTESIAHASLTFFSPFLWRYVCGHATSFDLQCFPIRNWTYYVSYLMSKSVYSRGMEMERLRERTVAMASNFECKYMPKQINKATQRRRSAISAARWVVPLNYRTYPCAIKQYQGLT